MGKEFGASIGAVCCSSLEINLPTLPFLLRIFYKKRFLGKKKYIWAEKEFLDEKGKKKIKPDPIDLPTILTGNPEFDQTFGLIGDNQSKILGVLDRKMQEKLMVLKKLVKRRVWRIYAPTIEVKETYDNLGYPCYPRKGPKRNLIWLYYDFGIYHSLKPTLDVLIDLAKKIEEKGRF
jgi:hypothetical protein